MISKCDEQNENKLLCSSAKMLVKLTKVSLVSRNLN